MYRTITLCVREPEEGKKSLTKGLCYYIRNERVFKPRESQNFFFFIFQEAETFDSI